MPVQYTLVKLPIKELVKQKFNVEMDKKSEIDNEYLIQQDNSLLFDQIERLRGFAVNHINELILVVAKKNPKQEEALRYILNNGFTYNGVHFSRFGKSASQSKDGITAFVCDHLYEELYRITQLDIKIEACVISKYEAQRCLSFSSCTLIKDYMPNIIIIGEYEKILPNQFIKYVVEKEKEFQDKDTGENITYKSREIEEGYHNIRLSPFDGCGCHEKEFMEQVSAQLGLDYNAVGAQIRLPGIKGYSVYVPFRDIFREWGLEYITDIYGRTHHIDTVDCIWNTSMFKWHSLFQAEYGKDAWKTYVNTVHKYQYKLGISKYSHHIKNLNKYTRMNFQYLQCLDLWNPKYIRHFEDKSEVRYDILDENNDGKIIKLAQYTTSLFEKIIKGDKFYTYKFMGITSTEDCEPESKYLEAALMNDVMLKDPAVKQFIYRKLKKSIDEAKVGKIYCSGFYHTGVGDMIGYLQYAAGLEPAGCLEEKELYCANFDIGDCVSFRSPLVDPSEVNKIKLVRNGILDKWFSHFKDQDLVMFNMHDLSAPGQGGADFDGDIFFLSRDPILLGSKIEKPIVLDIEDKLTAKAVPYTKENLVEYEVLTRDNRIGEITNAATSIENRYTTNKDIQKLYSDYAALLRVFQGKEIDFLKTGFRWHMNSGLRKHLNELPYFLLFNYPRKMKTYQSLCESNKNKEKEEKLKLNAYRSPSPMNELCDYICTWEKKNILWDHSIGDLTDTRALIVDAALDLSDKKVMRTCRKYINDYALEIKRHLEVSSEKSDRQNHKFYMEMAVRDFKERLSKELGLEERLIANYVIQASYASLSISKSFAWAGYSGYILENLRHKSHPAKTLSVREITEKTEDSYEYLGKYYTFEEGDAYVPM